MSVDISFCIIFVTTILLLFISIEP